MKTREFAHALSQFARMLKAGPNVELKELASVGLLLRFLEDHPDAMRKLHTDSAKKSKKGSPQLMKALSFLLGAGAGAEGAGDG